MHCSNVSYTVHSLKPEAVRATTYTLHMFRKEKKTLLKQFALRPTKDEEYYVRYLGYSLSITFTVDLIPQLTFYV